MVTYSKFCQNQILEGMVGIYAFCSQLYAAKHEKNLFYFLFSTGHFTIQNIFINIFLVETVNRFYSFISILGTFTNQSHKMYISMKVFHVSFIHPKIMVLITFHFAFCSKNNSYSLCTRIWTEACFWWVFFVSCFLFFF